MRKGGRCILYNVGIRHKKWSSIDDAKYAIVPYNDFAFCVTVDNHSIYVRRNGVAAFTGNSNYREKLLTLPHTARDAVIEETGIEKPTGKPYVRFRWNDETYVVRKEPEETDRAAMARRLNDTSQNQYGTAGYRSSHWDEPNVLVHRRTNEREVNGVPSLHVEEIQSDWHQQGRQKGYGSKADLPRFHELNTQLTDARNNLESVMSDIRKEHGLSSAEDSLRQVSDRELRAKMVEQRANAYNSSDKYKNALAEVKRLEEDTSRANPVGKIPNAPTV